jgi:hypothetical protein
MFVWQECVYHHVFSVPTTLSIFSDMAHVPWLVIMMVLSTGAGSAISSMPGSV